MGKHEKRLEAMRRSPDNVRFEDAVAVCEKVFGPPRQQGTSYVVFETPWAGDPRVNLQEKNGRAKPYQVRQVLRAIDKLEGRA